MNAELAVGIDLGTSGVKVVLLDADGRVVRVRQAGYSVDTPRPGWAQTDPADWLAATRLAVGELLEGIRPERIVGVGLDGQMHALLLLDAEDKPVRPAMLWPDSRATPQVQRWRELPEPARAVLANPLAPGMTGPLLCWLRDAEPEAYARGARLVAAKDYLRHQLVPGLCTDLTDASATLLWDVPGERWAAEVVAGVGLDRGLLPAARPSDDVAGPLEAADWGLPRGIPVAVGCSDVAATVLGADVSERRRTVIAGTGAQVLQTGVPAVPDAAPRYHTYRGVDGVYAMAAIQNGGLALDWVRRVLGASWPELYATLRGGVDPAGPLFLPYLSGERAPRAVPGSRGAWVGLGLETDREGMLRAAVQGVALAIRDGLRALPPVPDPLIDLVGGAARSVEFQQLLADVLDAPVRRVDVPDATGIGAALLGWRAAGRPDVRPALGVHEVVRPRPESASAYAALGERFASAAAERS